MGGFTGADRAELVLACGDAGAAAINFEPAGFHQDAAFGFEYVRTGETPVLRHRRNACAPFDAGEARRLLKLGGRIEDGDEALDDHVVKFLFGFAELGELAGRDDGKVIRDFFAVENAA